MKYYIEVQDDEHYLNPYEIATIFGVYSKANKPHSRFVARLMTNYYNLHADTPKFYFNGSKGLSRVYPACIYAPIMLDLINNYDSDKEHAIQMGEKTHYFIIKMGE